MSRIVRGAFVWALSLSLLAALAACNSSSSTPSTSGSGSTSLAAPTGVSATAGDTEATLSWTAVSGATSYNVYWSTSSGVSTSNGTKIASVTSPYVDTGFSDGTTYYFVVTAVDASGESGASGQVSAKPQATTPSPPTNVSATAGDGQVTIRWNNVTGATSYNVYWSTSSGVSTATGTELANKTSPYVQTGLTNGTKYYYVVTAENSAGESGASSQVGIAPQAAPTVAPTGVSATAGNGKVTVNWNAVTGATSYNLYWSTSSGVTTTTGNRITNVPNPYVYTPLANGTTYYFVVTALTASTESGISS